jgi:hypothetical protein
MVLRTGEKLMSRIMHARPSPSMVIAFIALLVAGGGAAFAAIPDSDDGEIHGCYSNNKGDLRVIDAQAGETCNTSKETALVWNQEGPQGDPGTPGTPGSAGASALTGRAEGPISASTQPRVVYAGPNGASTHDNNEPLVWHLSPNATIVARDLAVATRISPMGNYGAGHTATFTLMDDSAPTSVSCTISPPGGVAELSCNSGAATATISPASHLSLRITLSGGPPPFGLDGPTRFGWRAATP